MSLVSEGKVSGERLRGELILGSAAADFWARDRVTLVFWVAVNIALSLVWVTTGAKQACAAKAANSAYVVATSSNLAVVNEMTLVQYEDSPMRHEPVQLQDGNRCNGRIGELPDYFSRTSC